jgi:hypothetical protein
VRGTTDPFAKFSICVDRYKICIDGYKICIDGYKICIDGYKICIDGYKICSDLFRSIQKLIWYLQLLNVLRHMYYLSIFAYVAEHNILLNTFVVARTDFFHETVG